MEQFFVSTVRAVIFDLGVSFRSLRSKAENIEQNLHSMFGRRFPVDYADDTSADDPFSGYKSMSQNVNWGIFEELARAAEAGELDMPVTPAANDDAVSGHKSQSDPGAAGSAAVDKPPPSEAAPVEASALAKSQPAPEGVPAADGMLPIRMRPVGMFWHLRQICLNVMSHWAYMSKPRT